MKFRNQLIIFFSIVMISSIGVTAFFAISYTESGIISTEIAKMQSKNREIMGNIDTLHSRASEDLIFALKNPKFEEYFELPETKAGNNYDENGVIQFTENQRKIKQELEQWIYHFQNKFDVDETCIIDATGQEHARLVLTKIEIDENLSPDEKSTPFFEPSFKKEKNEVHVQYPYVSPDTQRWVFAYVSPVELGSGQKPAIYHFEMPLSVFQDLLVVDSGRMYVLDPKGFVIADSEHDVSDTVLDYAPEKQFPPFQSVFASEPAKILDEMKTNSFGSGNYDVNGDKHFFVYEKLSTFDWILVYDKPENTMFVGNDSIYGLMTTIALAATVISAIGIFGVFVVSSRMSKPISKLAQEICLENPERLGQISTSNPEITQISDSVNNLLRKITKYQEEINLQNRELEIQKQQLERLAKVGELASRLTHNLKTPLTVIKSTVDILQYASKSIDDETKKKLERIKSASENLEKQIEEVLTYVRNKPLDNRNVKFTKLLESTLENILVPEGIKIDYADNDTFLQCDPDKLQVVLMNLITNAIDALKNNGTIKVNFAVSDNENLISISDDGPGIPPENLPKIFDSLFTTKSSGTGLGLPYCKSVIEQHGGTITVSTNPTTFTIRLPKKIISKTTETENL